MTHELSRFNGNGQPISTKDLLLEIECAAQELASGREHMSERRIIALRYLITENIIALGLDPENYYSEYRALYRSVFNDPQSG